MNQAGTLLAIKSVQIGIEMPSLGSLSTGASTVYLPLVQNGIHEICISKGILVMTIIESILETRPALATRISFLFLQPIDLIRHLGWISFKKREPSIFFPVAEHHDGFQMYASTLSPYNSLEMGAETRCLRRAEEGSRKTWPALLYVLSPGRTPVFLFTWQGIH